MTDTPEAKESTHKQLMGEPVKRPDGSEFSLWKYTFPNGNVEIFVVNPGLSTNYTQGEIELLGDGDFKRGIIRLGQAYYNINDADLHIGGERLLTKELAELEKK